MSTKKTGIEDSAKQTVRFMPHEICINLGLCTEQGWIYQGCGQGDLVLFPLPQFGITLESGAGEAVRTYVGQEAPYSNPNWSSRLRAMFCLITMCAQVTTMWLRLTILQQCTSLFISVTHQFIITLESLTVVVELSCSLYLCDYTHFPLYKNTFDPTLWHRCDLHLNGNNWKCNIPSPVLLR